MKKVAAFLLATSMCLGLTACGGGTAPSGVETPSTNSPAVENTGSVEPKDTIKIGIEIYDPTDQEFLALKNYCDNYLAEALNIEFVYSEAIADADGEIAFIDNCASAGCVGVIGYYNVTGAQAAWEAVDNGMYFIDCTPGVYDEMKGEELYLGSITYGDNGDYAAGKAVADYLVSQGCQNVVYSNGGADFGVQMFVDRQSGFMDGMGDANVTVVSGFPNADNFATDQNAALTAEGVDGVGTSFNAMAGWAQPVQAAGLDIPVATIGVVSQDFVDAMNGGLVDMVAAGNIERWALPICMIYQAANGQKITNENGEAVQISQAWLTFENGGDMAEYLEIMNTDHIYSAEEIKSCTTYEQLSDLAASYTLEDVLARRAG